MRRAAARPIWRAALLGAAAAGLLVSCAEQRQPPPPPAPLVEELPPPEPIVVQRRRVPRPSHKPPPPAPVSEAEAVGEPGPPMMEPATAQPHAALPQPKQLVGLDEAAATRLFGAATSETAEPPAKVWRYAVASCELDLYFYYDLRSARMRTLRYTFKGEAAQGEAADKDRQQACIDAIAAAHHG